MLDKFLCCYKNVLMNARFKPLITDMRSLQINNLLIYSRTRLEYPSVRVTPHIQVAKVRLICQPDSTRLHIAQANSGILRGFHCTNNSVGYVQNLFQCGWTLFHEEHESCCSSRGDALTGPTKPYYFHTTIPLLFMSLTPQLFPGDVFMKGIKQMH